MYSSQAYEIIPEQFKDGTEAAAWSRKLQEAPPLIIPSQGMLRSLRSAENPRSWGIFRSLRSNDVRNGGILRLFRSNDPREGGILRYLRLVSINCLIRSQG